MDTGCKLSKEDLRDYRIRAGGILLPSNFKLDKFQKVKNQQTVSSCVAHATSSILEYHDRGENTLSTNFIYGFEDTNEKGMYLRDACDIVQKYGDMLERDCPGNYEKPAAHTSFLKSVNEGKYNTAYQYRIDSYYLCSTNNDIKYAIMNYGPVLAALKWYDTCSIDYSTGNVTMDLDSDYSYHAIVIYGWDESGFLCQNSWGSGWGKKGLFHINYEQNLVAEARALVDHVENGEDRVLVKPTTNKFLDKIYKGLNFILNTIKEIKNKT